MKADPESVRTLLGDLGEAPVPLDSPEREGSRRARVVSHIHKEMGRSEAARARLPRFAWISAAAVLLLAIAGWAATSGGGSQSGGDTTVATPSPPLAQLMARGSVLVDSKPLSAGAVGLELPIAVGQNAEAVLKMPSGARVAARAETTFWVAGLRAHETVYLQSGFASFEIPKLPSGSRFGVRTPLGEVVVHGTKFSVRVSDRPPRMEVDVTEGIVSVRYNGEERRLRHGERWSSVSSADRVPSTLLHKGAPGAGPTGPAEPTQSARPSTPASAPLPPRPEAPKSTLAQENALFRQAVGAERSGKPNAALALYEKLLRVYPKSPLAPDARVRRFRILREIGEQDAAAKEAQRYMAEHPEGFAHDEAREVAGQRLKAGDKKK